MEACDISLVKEENIELIKTEPQNEDEFDICGQSGIKTEHCLLNVRKANSSNSFSKDGFVE
uniref:Uncharacterized protein n=1 Tax=Timema genevievae TaxID=629358 RepID=A0A7R9PSN2_TIMGE|nr:unnamed protein product [Timema genevievae]